MRHPRLTAVVLLWSWIAVPVMAQNSKIVRAGPDKIHNQYIIVLNDDVLPDRVPDMARQLAGEHGAQLKKVWFSAIKGFAANMPEARAEAMSRNPHVKYVEENAPMYLSSTQQTNIDPGTCDPTVTTCPIMNDNRLWHLDRADQNYADPNNSYSYCTTGSGVTIYVVDTGVVGAHAELSGRVQAGFNSSGDNMPASDPCLGFALPPTGTYSYVENGFYRTEWRGPGHGTAVASAAAGRRVGVAKNATIVPIKTSRCDYYSARYRVTARQYMQNEPMFIVDDGGYSVRGLYRATNTGFTSGNTDPISSWPVGTSQNPRPQRIDGGVVWEFVPVEDWYYGQTVEMIIDGLNWILSPSNPGQKSYAVVTLSTYRTRIDAGVATPPPTRTNSLEEVIRSLLANNLTVIASANNQNGNACDTSPARLSRNNPDTAVANKVITAGGSMIINQPWAANLNDPPAVGPDDVLADGSGKGLEPAYDASKGVSEGRWICGAGDSDPCSNATPTSTVAVTSGGYYQFTGGSNAGACVTLFAPAKNLFLARNTGPNDYRDARLKDALASGTSWSAPIVAGFAARILQVNPTATPDQVYNLMMQNVSVGVLDPATLNTYDTNGVQITGTPNKLLRLADVNITTAPQSTTYTPGGTATFTVNAGGTGALSYQWYQVNPSFDSTTYARGAHPPDASTPIGTNSNTLQVMPSGQTAYWVRVSSGCGSADSDIVVASPIASPPANVEATASGATVTITWTPSSGADGYQVERKVSSSDWQVAQTVNGGSASSVMDTPGTPNGVVVYRVKSRSGTFYSGPSNSAVAYAATFTDDPIGTPTGIKAEHVTELRKAINTLLDIGQQSPAYSVLDPAQLRQQPVVAADFVTLMAKLNEARSTNGLLPLGFTTPPSATGPIIRTHIEELRNGVK